MLSDRHDFHVHETYYASAVNVNIMRARAFREVVSHGCDWATFLRECGDQQTYLATDVLDWLGY
jgi:hypothetical protein